MCFDNIPLSGATFRKKENDGFYEPAGSEAAGQAAVRSTKNNRAVTDAIPYWQDWREDAKNIKLYTVANLDKLLVEFERNMTARGATVLWAETADEANKMILDISRDHNVKSVVKGKSMVSEELGINHVFEAAGIKSLETDLGEYLVQLAGQRPTHIVTPALHLSAAQIGSLYEEKLGEPFTEKHEELTAIARNQLRQAFLDADMGMSGANFGIADTGTLAIVENEGNIGLATATPPVHVVTLGIEKMIPSVYYLPTFLNMIARVGTGQKLTTYTHLIRGAVPGSKLYVILLDNGRTKLMEDPRSRRSLTCIRCGMCLNVCPVYRRVGGWTYGWVYPGPIGSIISPQMIGMKQAGTLPFASSLCGACSEVCPAKVDIPHQLVYLRNLAVKEPSPAKSITDRFIWNVWSWAMSGPLRYKLTMRTIRIGVGLLKFVPRCLHIGKIRAWTRGRELPRVPQGQTFRGWWIINQNDIRNKNKS